MKNLFNKVIIVTGGNGLIGESIVDDLISEGAIVINADVGLVDDYNNNQFFCDVTKEISVATLLKTVVKKYDKIDGLVNNAYPKTADWGNKFEDIKYESWKKNIDIQLNSVFITTKAIVDIMKIQGFGSIINVATLLLKVA